ncbi:ABC transporter, membrane protein [Citrifermentans bemidjiense Bem]|uniref:ABC transporter, membrane protein n=1 Tax=Citrifermentans bemidjiense (strain ATCC BAA-1014 / DSM 16622 / JCM 12645 / Bem) TaxID=404380 RepID=B5ECW3_CITBB|nr:FtsX-like permease family protein [Citrifermentans bemidjiense]ACH40580.1 ABC transporter, membrane protein [Citrifermentans bemidjiense Bem]
MIERHRYILDFTLASLLRRKGKNSALLVVYILVVFVAASVLFFTHALQYEASLLLEDAPDIVVQNTLTGRQHPVPVKWRRSIGEIRGVASVAPRLWGYQYDKAFAANYTLLVPVKDEPPSGSIDIGSAISRTRNAYPGDIISLPGSDGRPHAFTIRQTLSSESQLLTGDLMVLSEKDFRELSGIPKDQATDLVLRVPNAREQRTVAAKITRLYPEARPILREEMRRTYDAVYGWRSSLLLVVFSGAGLAFFIFAWDKATGISAEERKEIGILKAIGWETSDILLMKFWEGIVISLCSFLAGSILAYFHVFASSSALFLPVLKGWSTLYPTFRLQPSIDYWQLAVLFFLTVIPYTIATIIPFWRAATIDPDVAMR